MRDILNAMRDIMRDILRDIPITMSIIFHIVDFRPFMFLLPNLYHVGEGHRKLRTVGVKRWQHTFGEKRLRTIGVKYLAHA